MESTQTLRDLRDLYFSERVLKAAHVALATRFTASAEAVRDALDALKESRPQHLRLRSLLLEEEMGQVLRIFPNDPANFGEWCLILRFSKHASSFYVDVADANVYEVETFVGSAAEAAFLEDVADAVVEALQEMLRHFDPVGSGALP
jgi:hypothetical protein